MGAVMMIALIERGMTLARLWCFHEDRGGKVSTRDYNIIKFLIIYQMASYIWFANIFAVQPNDMVTARLHTVPYTNVKLALASAAWTTLHSAYHHDMYANYSLSDFQWTVLRTYTIALTLCALPAGCKIFGRFGSASRRPCLI